MSSAIRIALAAVVAGIGIVAYMSVFTVTEREQALVLQFGEPIETIQDAGIHFKSPIQDVIFFDKRILALDSRPEELIASDQKRMVVDAIVRFQIEDPLTFYRAVATVEQGRNRLERFVNSTLRRVLGSVPFNDILKDSRAELMAQIQVEVNVLAAPLGVNVVDVRIKRADLPEENSQAIYQRMETQREQEARLLRAEGNASADRIRAEADRVSTITIANADRDGSIIRGEGDGERNRIYAEAFTIDEDFFNFYRSMQAYRKAMSDTDTTMILSPDSDFFRYFKDADGG